MKYYLFVLAIAIITITACQNFNNTNSLKNDFSNSMKLDTTALNSIHKIYKEKALYHRRFKHNDIDSLVQLHKKKGLLGVQDIGCSVEGRSLYELTYGNGDKKVMLWSQMHGDEPTATMALFDIFNFLEGKEDGYDDIRKLLNETLTLYFIPMVNPDGAERYTRRNAQQIDLNRDARATQTVEGAILKERAQKVKPAYGFNLHDQNIYYNVPDTQNPVTISLLAPAYNPDREKNTVRTGAMQIIVGMNHLLQQYIPNAVAKYDDTYTPRGFGDNFQSWGTSTVLIESGGLKGDPEKQEIRRLNFAIILHALVEIAEGSYTRYDADEYQKIPFNASQMHDVVIRNLVLKRGEVTYRTDVAIRRGETTVDRDYFVRGRVEDIGDLQESYGYEELDAKGMMLIPAQVDAIGVSNLSALNKDFVLEQLRKGVMAIRVQTVGITKSDNLYSWPILLFTQRQFYPTTTIDLGGTANFFIGESAEKLKFAVINGYLFDMAKDELPDLKNRIF